MEVWVESVAQTQLVAAQQTAAAVVVATFVATVLLAQLAMRPPTTNPYTGSLHLTTGWYHHLMLACEAIHFQAVPALPYQAYEQMYDKLSLHQCRATSSIVQP